MSDLISILSEIRSSYNCFDEKEEPYYRALGEAIRLVSAQQDGAYGYVSAEEIADAPSIDAEPVRHGHWIHERLVSTSGGTYAVVRCSECKWQHPMVETKFCPNCGARMEEDNETD